MHVPTCPHLHKKTGGQCVCPTRLTFEMVDSLIGKLRVIFDAIRRTTTDASFPEHANPASAPCVKRYLVGFREELNSHVTPSQAEPFFLDDLTAVSHLIATNI